MSVLVGCKGDGPDVILVEISACSETDIGIVECHAGLCVSVVGRFGRDRSGEGACEEQHSSDEDSEVGENHSGWEKGGCSAEVVNV